MVLDETCVLDTLDRLELRLSEVDDAWLENIGDEELVMTEEMLLNELDTVDTELDELNGRDDILLEELEPDELEEPRLELCMALDLEILELSDELILVDTDETEDSSLEIPELDEIDATLLEYELGTALLDEKTELEVELLEELDELGTALLDEKTELEVELLPKLDVLSMLLLERLDAEVFDEDWIGLDVLEETVEDCKDEIEDV
ncbi:hypothetical protein L228DRAFT_264310 [Xylona heveae TC161]|uniref:Uncharacterized protein n=1 Tax=Xylona heveae (strain CBS 132557 / TC161) TaxID=1328760 RepID=A0A165J7Y1_XYLHT|nr:hypothetical protein L228DRAFT_264310 [Xylona heveae TC161]KZF25868.1 hypothetical protein L228DRAFT_264310 [Xylona heveae TC161]